MAKKTKAEKGITTWPLYLLLAVVFVVYIVYQRVYALSLVLGAMLFVIIAIVVVVEIINSVKDRDYKRDLLEMIAAIVIILLLWFALKFFLHTNYPLDVVPSCSMLPVLHRGDMIALQGIDNVTDLKAPVIDVSASAYKGMLNNFGSEQLLCLAYKTTNGTTAVSQFMQSGYSIGLYSSNQSGGSIISPGDQTGLITYTCGTRMVKFDNGTIADEVYTSAINVAGTTVIGDSNHTVIVYQTVPQDYFYEIGDMYIVHRVYAVLDVAGKYYALTKGDNNPGLDIQYSNYPANESDIQGRIIASIPYLGYLKLILSNQFSEPAGCNSYPIS
jgi:signal peptidase I